MTVHGDKECDQELIGVARRHRNGWQVVEVPVGQAFERRWLRPSELAYRLAMPVAMLPWTLGGLKAPRHCMRALGILPYDDERHTKDVLVVFGAAREL
jgi:hypothetical protein